MTEESIAYDDIESFLKDVPPLQRVAVRIKIGDYAAENPYVIPQIVPFLTEEDLEQARRAIEGV